MKKPVIKALACGLALFMALSTPVDALATSITNIFTSSVDGEGQSNTNTDTRTGSHTNTNSGVIEIDPTIEYNVIGVAFDKEAVTSIIEDGGDQRTQTLNAVILISDEADGGQKGTESIRVQELLAYDDLLLTLDGQKYSPEDLYQQLTFYEDPDVCVEKGLCKKDEFKSRIHIGMNQVKLMDLDLAEAASFSEEQKNKEVFIKEGILLAKVEGGKYGAVKSLKRDETTGKLVETPSKMTASGDSANFSTTAKAGFFPRNIGDEVRVTGMTAGKTYVSVRLGETYKASALVTVKDYNAQIKIGKIETQYQKHTINLNDYVDAHGMDITWRAYTRPAENKQKTYKVAADGKITFSATTMKFNKQKDGLDKATIDGYLYVEATAENGKTDTRKFMVEPGNPITGFAKGKDENKTWAPGKLVYQDKDKKDEKGNILKDEKENILKENDSESENLLVLANWNKSKYYGKDTSTPTITDAVKMTIDKPDVLEFVIYNGKTVSKVLGSEATYTRGNLVTVTGNVTGSGKGDAINLQNTEEKFVGVRPTGAGTAKVTITASSGKKLVLTYKVTAPLKAITGIKDRNDMYFGQSETLKAVTDPSKTDTKITWKVYDIKSGATTSDVIKKGDRIGKTASGEPELKASAFASIKANKDSSTAVLTAKVKTDLEKVVYVQASGTSKIDGVSSPKMSDYYPVKLTNPLITGKDKNIICAYEKNENGEPDTKKSLLTFTNPAKKAMSLYKGKAFDLDVELERAVKNGTDDNYTEGNAVPYGTAQGMVTWTSNKPKVVSVDPRTGRIEALSAGEATITVSAAGVTLKNGAIKSTKVFKDTIKVKVSTPVTGITLKQSEFTYVPNPNKKTTLTFNISQYMPKACTKEVVKWEALTYNEEGKEIPNATGIDLKYGGNKNTAGNTKSAKLTIEKTSQPTVGTKIVVTATSASGAKAKATINVCDETVLDYGIKKSQAGDTKPLNKIAITIGDKTIKDATKKVSGNYVSAELEGKNGLDLKTYFVTNNKDTSKTTENYEKLTSSCFTVNKKGIVNIVGSRIYPVKAGTVTVTAKLPSGAKKTLTIIVQDNAEGYKSATEE